MKQYSRIVTDSICNSRGILMRLARHKQFGASSEKSEETLMEQLSFLFNEAEVFSAAEKEAEENITVVAAHKRHKKHEYTPDNIPEDIVNTPGGNGQFDRASPTPIPLKSYTLSVAPTPPV